MNDLVNERTRPVSPARPANSSHRSPWTFAALVVLVIYVTLPAFALTQDNTDRARAREQFERLQVLANPGPEHKQLKTLTGPWCVSMTSGDKDLGFDGTATASMILEDRFLVIDGSAANGQRKSAFRYTIGFDRRHGEYVIILMDNAGTYHVTARGKPVDGRIRVFGTDDDPHMKSMGFEKKFGFELNIKSADQFSITTIFVDTRTKEEKLRPAFRHDFERIPDPTSTAK